MLPQDRTDGNVPILVDLKCNFKHQKWNYFFFPPQKLISQDSRLCLCIQKHLVQYIERIRHFQYTPYYFQFLLSDCFITLWSVKLNSYSNASVFLSLCCMRISIFLGHEHLTNRSISKHYLKSDIATWVEKSSVVHEHFIASSGVWVWMKALQLIAKRWKNASVWVWIQLKN